MPPKHLVLLQAMFPGVMMLDIDQIASLTRYGRGHLYNLNYKGKLPFKVSRGSRNKILVSIIEFAAYLDKTSLSEYAPPVDQPPELIVKKPGRPRGSTARASATVSSFQSELHAAIYRVQARELLSGIGHRIAGERLDGDESMGCEEQMRKTLSRLSAAVEAASYEFEQLHARLSNPESPDIPYEARQIPFFVSPEGLVVALVVDEFADHDASPVAIHQVRWMTWASALSLVWHDESKRLAWLEKMAIVVPSLHDTVDALRRDALHSI